MALAGGELAAKLRLSGACGRAVCLERGTPIDSIEHWNKYFDPSGPTHSLWDEFSGWFMSECQAAEIGFVSCECAQHTPPFPTPFHNHVSAHPWSSPN